MCVVEVVDEEPDRSVVLGRRDAGRHGERRAVGQREEVGVHAVDLRGQRRARAPRARTASSPFARWCGCPRR